MYYETIMITVMINNSIPYFVYPMSKFYYQPASGSSTASSCGPWVSVPCPWSPPSRPLAPSPAGPYCTPSPSGSCRMGRAKPPDTPRCARSSPSCRLTLTSCPGTGGGTVQDSSTTHHKVVKKCIVFLSIIRV